MASLNNLHETKEFSIPFPGGQIAAKMWGNETGIPVLAMHGWQDNLGTFDRLIPLLSSDFCVVGFDCIGHGLSSHKPAGVFYNYIDMLIEIKRVIDYLKWHSFTIMGHSLGATLGLMYGSLFPENVVNIICLDIIKPNSRYIEDLPVSTRHTIQEMIRLEQKLLASPPVYSYEKAKERLMQILLPEKITADAADALLKRGTKISPCGNGIVFTRDIRIKVVEGIQMLSNDAVKIYMSKLRCNLLIIVGINTVVHLSRTPKVIPEFLDIYKKNCNSFQLIKVKGNHFFHLNNPEVAVPHINSFLKKYGQNKSNL